MHCRRTYATLTAALAILALMLAAGPACAPATPAGQGNTPENPVVTGVVPMPTLPAEATVESERDGTTLPPPPTRSRMKQQYPHLSGYLIRKIQEYEADAAAVEGSRTAASSGRPTPTPEVIDLYININTHEYVDVVQRFLEENGVSPVKCAKFPSDYIIRGQCAAVVPVSLLRGLAEQPGVTRIEKIQVAQPASELRSPSPQQSIANAPGSTPENLTTAPAPTAEGWDGLGMLPPALPLYQPSGTIRPPSAPH